MMKYSPLGKSSAYKTRYDAGLLFPIARQEKRTEIGLSQDLPFQGNDIWNAYELSWLNSKGKPHIAVARFTIPYDSPNLIESKSLKLYLNSFNQTTFTSADAVRHLIKMDLSRVVGKTVDVTFITPSQFQQQRFNELPGVCLDNQDITIDRYQYDANLLRSHANDTDETLYSHLLRSNCPITEQPDWASVMIRYQGKQIDHASLLRYLVSFRQHNEFHEQCVERMFVDLSRHCQPKQLTVYARFTRRGGIDINPLRTNIALTPSPDWRSFRQ